MNNRNIFYVYAYLRQDLTPYYVGKGSKNRAWASHIRSDGVDLLPNDLSKIVILRDMLLEHDAYNYEIELIKRYGREDLRTGILLNRTNGGSGNKTGYNHTSDAIEKIRYAGIKGSANRIAAGTHNFVTNPPRANLNGVVTKKLVAEGRHNLLKRPDGTSVSSDRVSAGTHHFVDPEWKKQHGISHSKWIQQQIEKGEYYLIINNPAKIKVCCIVCQKETNLMGLSRFHKH